MSMLKCSTVVGHHKCKLTRLDVLPLEVCVIYNGLGIFLSTCLHMYFSWHYSLLWYQFTRLLFVIACNKKIFLLPCSYSFDANILDIYIIKIISISTESTLHFPLISDIPASKCQMHIGRRSYMQTTRHKKLIIVAQFGVSWPHLWVLQTILPMSQTK